jgi:glycosyltransferase involved in cell wall biosynthesis
VNAPPVSVVIPSYNYGRYIKTAIDSALAQDYPNLEVVVSENCSKDETMDVLASYASDSRVRVHVNPRNIGLTPNINKGITLANGQYVVMLSADDFLLPGHTRHLVDIAENHPDVALVYGNAYFAEETGVPHTVRNIYGQLAVEYVGGRNEFAWLFMTCYMCLPTILFRKSMFERYGLFDDALDIASDWEICMRMAAGGESFAYTPLPVAAIRNHPAQRSAAAYTHAGDELREALEIGERYATSQFADRYHGYERRMSMLAGDRLRRLRDANPALAQEMEPRARAFVERLAAFAELPREVPDPTVSVVVTTSGRIVSLRRTLGSLAKQTHQNWEAIVVQDGGIDVRTLLGRMPGAARLRYARTYDRLGPTAAREAGSALLTGDYVAFLDEDDEFAPDHLASLVAAIKANGSAAASSATRLVCDEYYETTLYARPFSQADDVAPLRAGAEDLEVAPCVPLGSVLFTAAALDDTLIFKEKYGVLSGWEMLLRRLSTVAWSQTGSRTFVQHAAAGLVRQELGAHFGGYIEMLERVYADHPASSAQTREKRERHIERLRVLFARPAESYRNGIDLVRLYGSLAGLHIASAVLA